MTQEKVIRFCACGCGREITSKWHGGKVKYIKNHYKLTPEQEQKRCKAISEWKKTIGNNYGRAARDRIDHCKAHHWIIRDNKGILYEFNNLKSWCRKNEEKFLPDEFPDSKLPLWRRAYGGFNNMQRTDRRAAHSWKGWTLVSVIERKEIGAPDLLARNFIENNVVSDCK